jgi:hypothetical protein
VSEITNRARAERARAALALYRTLQDSGEDAPETDLIADLLHLIYLTQLDAGKSADDAANITFVQHKLGWTHFEEEES